jgi:hypothetical protein
MNGVLVAGLGAVSPAGWGVKRLAEALACGQPLATVGMARPGWTREHQARRVPAVQPRPSFLGDARLRRSTPIAQYVVGSALEALGEDVERVRSGSIRLGIVVCTMCGCVGYTRRFYDEILRDVATASPLLFPETVFNAPGSHLAAVLGSTGLNYTLVGDEGSFAQGLAMGAGWLEAGLVDGCVVVGGQELDWVVPDALRRFTRRAIACEGAGAVYLRWEPVWPGAIALGGVTSAHLYRRGQPRSWAAERMRHDLETLGPADLLCDGLQGVPILDRVESALWSDWAGSRLSPLRLMGSGFVTGAGWQAVAAIAALRRGDRNAAWMSVVGCNEQAVGIRFEVCG